MQFLLMAACALMICFSTPRKGPGGPRKEELRKLRWIEGSWSGLHKGNPFYEVYRFVDDTTLEITGYEWDGRDSSKSSVSRLHWKDEAYYLGTDWSWKAEQITDSTIYLRPHHKAVNDILWKRVDRDRWDAVLTTPKNETVYHMKRTQHFTN